MSSNDGIHSNEVLENEEEYEEDDPEGEAEEEYERWVASQEPGFRFKPVVIGLLVAAVVGVGAVVLATTINDPADRFDSAPILQKPSDETASVDLGEMDRALSVTTPEDRPRPSSPASEDEATQDLGDPEAADQPQPEVAEAEIPAAAPEPVPAPEVEVVPAQAEAASNDEPAEYTVVLEQAGKERSRKKKQELLRQAIALNPNGDEALATLALILMEGGKTRDEALDLASRAVAANPDNGLGWLVIGYVKQVGGKSAEAKEAYRRCAGCSGPVKYVRECRQLG